MSSFDVLDEPDNLVLDIFYFFTILFCYGIPKYISVDFYMQAAWLLLDHHIVNILNAAECFVGITIDFIGDFVVEFEVTLNGHT